MDFGSDPASSIGSPQSRQRDEDLSVGKFPSKEALLEGDLEKLEKTVRDILNMMVLGGDSPLETVPACLEE